MTTGRFSFIVYGAPQAKGSTRAFVVRHAGGAPRAILTSTNRSLKAWEALVRSAAQRARAGRPLLLGPVVLDVVFEFARPKRLLTKTAAAHAKVPHVGVPDLDKLVRGVGDGLSGVLFLDDKQVCEIFAKKRYAPVGDGGSCRVSVIDATVGGPPW